MITKASLEQMINEADAEKRARIIGRACVVLFLRQTEDEKATNHTKHTNERGFSKPDARQGTITAKYFLKHGKLEDWQVARWIKRESRGNMRIAKYWKQLDEAARAKAQAAKAA